MMIDVEATGRFRLSPSFMLEQLKRPVNWGFGALSFVTFKRTYARPHVSGHTETWAQTCCRVVEGTFTILKWRCKSMRLPWDESRAQAMAQDMFTRMFTFKFLPPGRGLWMMGSEFVYEDGGAALNNCFSADTRLLLASGEAVTMKEAYSMGEVEVYDAEGVVQSAVVKSFGVQPLQRVTMRPANRSNYQVSFDVTPDHRWLLDDGTETTSLQVGQFVTVTPPVVDRESVEFCQGMAHGIVFGDGTRRPENARKFQLRLCGNKNELVHLFKEHPGLLKCHQPDWAEGDHMVYVKSDVDLKALPEAGSREYVAGFIEGWTKVDSKYGMREDVEFRHLATTDLEARDWLLDNCYHAGFTVTGGWQSKEGDETNFGPRKKTLYVVTLREYQEVRYKVLAIEDLEKEEEVFCVVQPKTHSFCLAGGIPTGNCGYISTQNVDTDFAEPFCWAFHMLMLGVGVGFDTRGEHVELYIPPENEQSYAFVVQDSRQGWVEAARAYLTALVEGSPLPEFDYSGLRPAGAPIRRFGGTASGPQPLREMFEKFRLVFNRARKRSGLVDSTLITDLMNIIGVCVVSGNVRRSAEIALGRPGDVQFRRLKSKEMQVDRPWYWTSNNSVVIDDDYPGDYSELAEGIIENGEPGIFWIDNARNYGRMADGRNPNADPRVMGVNPCVEQSLEDHELCTLVETFPAHHATYDDYEKTLKMAYLYAKVVTLVPTHDARTNAVMRANSRIGCSMAGVAQALDKFGMKGFFGMCDVAYRYLGALDEEYSRWMCCPQSIKRTSIKPGGTTPLVAGAEGGMTFPHAEYYIRRIRCAESSPLWEVCQDAGIPVETDEQDSRTKVISFPVRMPHTSRNKFDVSMFEQFAIASKLQRSWADNQVSATITFTDDEAKHIASTLNIFEDQLKGISMLKLDTTAYAQPPYESISVEEYENMMVRANMQKVLDAEDVFKHERDDKYCDGAACEVDLGR